MTRLDVKLFENKTFETREKAKNAIKSGSISVNGKVCTKPSTEIKDTDKLEVTSETLKYVSRAGLKLEGAKQIWNIDFSNKFVLDVGASTGGFTDFSLQNGARKVVAIDVGTNQLHSKLKNDNRVLSLEKTDFRDFDKNNYKICEDFDIAVCDCSFISLKLLAHKFFEVLKSGAKLVVLIKPQFECGKELAKKYKGVIKDKTLQEKIKNEIVLYFETVGFKLLGTADSPILGGDGNKEFLAYFER